MSIKDVLIALSENAGVSGYEDQIAQLIIDNCPDADQIRRDKLGNLIMLKKANVKTEKPPVKVILAAHMDEID